MKSQELVCALNTIFDIFMAFLAWPSLASNILSTKLKNILKMLLKAVESGRRPSILVLLQLFDVDYLLAILCVIFYTTIGVFRSMQFSHILHNGNSSSQWPLPNAGWFIECATMIPRGLVLATSALFGANTSLCRIGWWDSPVLALVKYKTGSAGDSSVVSLLL